MRIKVEVDCQLCSAVGELSVECKFQRITGYGDALVRESYGNMLCPEGWNIASYGRLACPKHGPEELE